jgi:hypothetical protein
VRQRKSDAQDFRLKSNSYKGKWQPVGESNPSCLVENQMS